MPGESCSIHFHATHSPAGWLQPWQSQDVSFPGFAVLEATRDRGAIAVQVLDDLTARPEQVQGLTPLDEKNKTQFHLDDVPTSLAYRYESRPFEVTFRVQRTQPEIRAETYSFLKIEPGNLVAHYEIFYRVREARTRELSFELPSDTPNEVSIRGLDGVALKESSSDDAEPGLRRWRVQLAEPRQGTIHLSVEFQQPLVMAREEVTDGDKALIEDLVLPIIRAADVQYQTGTMAVEGSAELEVTLETTARKVDVGELVEAEYRPGRRLLGVFGVAGEPTPIAIKITRPTGYGLPAAIVQRGELLTAISVEGLSQTAARFLLRTTAQYVEIQLPPESILWSAYLDQSPSKPQRDGDRLLISLPSAQDVAVRDLQLVYQTPTQALRTWASLSLAGPKLFLRERGQSSALEVPFADLAWQVHLPSGYRLADSRGTVFPNLSDTATRRQLAAAQSPWRQAAEVVLASPRPNVFLARQASRQAGRARFADATSAPASAKPESLGITDDEAITGDEATAGESKSEPATATGTVDELFFEAAEPRVSGLQAETRVAGPEPPRAQVGELWVIEGLRSLKIELAQEGEPMQFQSLGADPLLDVKLVDERRIRLLAWGVALLIAAVGLMLLNASTTAKRRYVVLVLILATVVPLLLKGRRPWGAALDYAFFTALGLVPIYLLVGFCRQLLTALRRPSVLALLLVLSTAVVGQAQPAPPPVTRPIAEPQVVMVVEPEPPVDVPPDAIIVPYDPAEPDGPQRAERIIVPYEKYVELWNLAYPDKKLQEVKPPAEFSIAGAQWRTTVTDDSSLRIEGQFLLDVHVDSSVVVPLGIGGGVLERAELDGEPARIQIVQPVLSTETSQAAQAQATSPEDSAGLTNLLVAGKGRKRLTLAIRYGLQRRGGWRVVSGRLPTATANALTLNVPQARTELRLTGVVDRSLYETQQAGERIETALAPEGSFRIEWRPSVAQADVDRSLTVDSDAVLDVQEDSLRLSCRLNLKFPLGQRDDFTIDLPPGYLVEQVQGENVRGWELSDGRLRITLLKTARDAQLLTLHLTRRGAVGRGELTTLDAPLVSLPDASLHEGRLTVRRSPLLELRGRFVRADPHRLGRVGNRSRWSRKSAGDSTLSSFSVRTHTLQAESFRDAD